MNVLRNTFGLKIGDSVVLVTSNSDLFIKQSGALRRKRAPLSGKKSTLRKIDAEELKKILGKNHAAEIGAVIGSSLGPLGLAAGAVAGNFWQNKQTRIGLRVDHANGEYVELLCNEKEFQQIAAAFVTS